MVSKTRKKKRFPKLSKKTLERLNNYEEVWGKNPKLESFWSDLAYGKKIIIIYKDKSHKYVALPKRHTKKYDNMIIEYNNDPNIIALLSSNMSSDAYELYLYPKAKDKTVDYVINHYTKYFSKIDTDSKLFVPL